MENGKDAVSSLTDLLAKTKVVQVNEVSFSGSGHVLDTAEDAQEIIDKIRSFKDVEALHLEGNSVGLEAAKAIADALSERKEFQKAFWSDMFTGRLRSEIPPSLDCLGNAIITSGASLTVLDLSDNAFGPDGVKGIQTLLKSQACYTLEVLKLNNNGLGIGGGKLLSQAFLECHRKSCEDGHPFALKVFISGRNRLENEGAKALAAAFKVMGTLEEIQMPQNGILHPGIAALGDAFAYNENLRIVNLNDNTFTAKGAAVIAKSLPKLSKLETLNLGDCLLSDAGASLLAEGLASGTPLLKELIVSFNEIRRDGALAICDSIGNKQEMTLFNIDGNQLGDSTEEVEEKMRKFGKEDILAPFDDNEEPDSDDNAGEDEEDDEEEEEDEEAEEEEEEEDKENYETAEEEKSNSDNILKQTENSNKETSQVPITNGISGPESGKIYAWEFLRSPSIANYEKIPSDGAADYIREAAKADHSTLDDYVNVFMNAASVLSSDTDALRTVTDALFPDTVALAKGKSADISGPMLTHLGLIKSEDKRMKAVDAHGPLLALTYAVQQKYWPKDLSDYFIVFLTKSNRILDQYATERHDFLQKLHQP